MKSNIWLRVVPVLVLVGALGACENDLTEINENPNNPEAVPVQSLLLSGTWDLVSNDGGRSAFGEWTTLHHTYLWSQHLAAPAYPEEDNYSPRQGINENIWSEMYAGPLLDLRDVQRLAEEGGDDNLWAVADIASVYGFLFLTDLFGDIPYFQALDLAQYPEPEFDPQSEIYPDLLQRLTAAAGMIDPAESTADWAVGDLIYGGDVEAWQKFANSLRLRIAMRTSNTEFASQAAQDFSAAWDADRLASNADIADLDWTGTLPSQNPLYENIVGEGRDADTRLSVSMVTALTDRNDPRLPIYAEPAASDGAFRGLRNGNRPVDEDRTVGEYSTMGSGFFAADAPSVLMSYAEVLLLGAEAAQRGWIAGDAEALCQQGIEASMQQHGVSQSAIDDYLAAIECNTLEEILTQKWIALYLAGPEAFAEVRRTGIPTLPLATKAVIDEHPARMPYPEAEGLYNPNFEDVKDIEITEPLWWMP